MELLAAISALEALKAPSRVDLHTDSKYVQDGIGKWIHGWKKNGWKTADQDSPSRTSSCGSASTPPASATRSTGAGSRATPATSRTSAPTSSPAKAWQPFLRR